MKFFLIASLLALKAFSADAGYEKVGTKTLFNHEELSEYKLKNGLRVLLLPRHQAKVVTFEAWFNVGSTNEKMDQKLKKTGLAHLFEHMMFRGTDKYPDGIFDKLTAQLGGEKQNATTHFYRTNYFESVPSKNLDKIIEMEADRMSHLKFTKEIFEKEKGAVVGELRRHLDNPMVEASDELHRQIFEVAPYRFTVIGTEEEIKGFTHDEAEYFYKTYYSPNNATLIIIGDVEEKPLMEVIEKYYGNFPSQVIPKLDMPTEPTQKKERKWEGTHPQATSEILAIGYPIPPVDAPDSIPLSLLETHLSHGMEARMRKILVDAGIAVSANAGTSSRPDTFTFFVQLAEKHHAEEALRAIDNEIHSLQKKPISKESFERALNQELLSLYSDMSDNSSMAAFLGEYLTLCNDYMRGFEIIEGYKKISPADLQRVSKDYLIKDHRSVVIIRPPKKEGK